MQNRKEEWDKSYNNGDNYLFYPHEEVIRFVSKFVRKRTGMESFLDIAEPSIESRVLDLGCGIGRHTIYCHEMGLDVYGIDLSESAIYLARKWGNTKNIPKIDQIFFQGDIRSLPWADEFFAHALSHAVLDSMPFEVAKGAVLELARVMKPGGLFYCDLISGDDSAHAREFTGEEVVDTVHENSTIQHYFNMHKIECLFEGLFAIVECLLIRRENILSGGYTSRYHLVLSRK